MDWIDWVIDLVTLLILGRMVMILLRIEKWMVDISHKVDEQKARQSTIAARRSSSSTPKVDAAARTTKRDSNDLPLTGRMGTAVHRKKRDYDRLGDDDRLQPGTGSSTAHVGEHPGRPAEGRAPENS